ncbi:TPA: hypothetical protein ACIYNR_005122 [Escherichia coli]
MELKGVGPTTACALVACIGNAHDFKGIRNFWLIKCQRCKEENLSQRII